MQNYSKVVLIGSTNVGKTSIITRATANTFALDQTPTVGASFFVKEVDVDGEIATLRVWDTAGQEKFRSLAPMYFQGAKIVLVVFAVDNRDSFDDVDGWMNDLRNSLDYEPINFLVGNKVDVDPEKIEVTEKEAQEKAMHLNATYFEVSAKTGTNIEELFTSMGETALNTNSKFMFKREPTVIVEDEAATATKKDNSNCC